MNLYNTTDVLIHGAIRRAVGESGGDDYETQALVSAAVYPARQTTQEGVWAVMWNPWREWDRGPAVDLEFLRRSR